ncbi:hypothetical protein F4678DRAFT_417420 [Xylaria arbuscula]|nr:hypothetical protein F4678DRAFT_417420 [Xylaria arbuscula]
MFLSWKPSGGGNQPHDTNRSIPFDPVTAKTQTSQACSNCRARKLKCVWYGGGCERCRASGRKCIYEATSAKAAGNARRRSRQGSSGTNAGPRWTGPDKAANSLSSPSPPGTSHQVPTTQPGIPLALTTADKDLAQSELNGSSAVAEMDVPSMLSLSETSTVTSMFSVDAPSTVESMFIGGDMGMISMLDIEMDADGSSSGQWKDADLNTSAGLDIGDHFTLATMGCEDMKLYGCGDPSTSTLALISGHTPKLSHERQTSDSSNSLCECLSRVVHLVDEIDTLVERDGVKSLDGALAAHKEALACGADMLDCIACTGRLENMIMLALMVDKLVRMCKHVAEACCTGLRGTGGETDAASEDDHPPETSPLLTLQRHTDISKQYRARGSAIVSTVASRVYSVDSSREYLFVVAGILRFQLQQLFHLTLQLQKVAAPLASDRISQRITACHESVRDMLGKAGFIPCEAAPEVSGPETPVPVSVP